VTGFFRPRGPTIAGVFALAGNTSEAVKWLRVSVREGMPNYPLFARDPRFDGIRDDPQFKTFMNELKTRWERLQHEFGS